MMLNTCLFAHILLDAELQGRFGVQGNTFANTIHYFNEYLNSTKTIENLSHYNQEKLQVLAKSIEQLAQVEDQVIQWNKSKVHSQDILRWSEDIASKILNLDVQSNEKILLPGGWVNPSLNDGHAMIYQLTKNSDGDVIFNIYNSGAGLQFHTKDTSYKEERFYPVKTYLIPKPVDLEEFRQFVFTLIQPLLTDRTIRTKSVFDEDLLYQSIQKHINFFNGTPILASSYELYCLPIEEVKNTNCYVFHENELYYIHPDTTVEKISIPAYQKEAFLKHFQELMIKKNYYLTPIEINQWITNYTGHIPEPHHYTTAGQISGTCTQRSIHQMIKTNFDTLENYQRFILQFKMHALREFTSTHLNPNYRITELILLAIENNLKILQQPGVFNEGTYQELIEMKKRYSILMVPTNTSKPVDEVIHEPFEIKAQPLTSFTQTNHSFSNIFKKIDSFYSFIPTRPTLDQLKKLIQLCEHQADAWWTMGQIETFILNIEIPIPELKNLEPSQLKEFISILTTLQNLYGKACYECLGNNLLPETIATQLSLIAQYETTHSELAQVSGKPSLGSYINGKLSPFILTFQNNPLMISYRPDVDKRLNELHHKYSASENVAGYTYYTQLIQTYPELYQLLMSEFEKLYLPSNSKDAFKGVEALYVLLQYKNADNSFSLPPSLDSQLFQPLIESIQEAVQFENFFLNCASHFNPQEKKFSSLNINLKSGFYRSNFVWQSPSSDISLTCPIIKDSKYDTLLKNDLINESKYTLHQVQLKKNLLQQELCHLRVSPENQIHFTLDFFKKNISLLLNKKNQLYLEANILEPHRIIEALEQDQLLPDFDELIQLGLQSSDFIHANGNVKQEGLFFIRLNNVVNQYLLKVPIDQKIIENRLQQDMAYLNAQIRSVTDTAILSSLHRYRFLHLCSQEKLLKDPFYLKQALVSFFYIQVHVNLDDTESVKEKLNRKRLEHVFKFYLQQQSSEALQTLLQPVFQTFFNQDATKFIYSMEYPFIYLNQENSSLTYTFHIEQGNIYINNQAYVPLPQHLLNHPCLKQLGLNDRTTCLLSSDGLIIEFPPNVRIKQNSKNQIVSIQKKWNINYQEDWYELQPTSFQNYFELDARPLLNTKLPKIINDAQTEFWIKDGLIGSLIIQNNQPRYILNEDLSLEELSPQGNKTGNLLQHHLDLLQKITPFESSDFVLIEINPKIFTGHIHCPRYQLSLVIDVDQNIYLQEDARFKLIPNQLPFGSNIARLTFSDGEKTQCIVPIQKFYVDSNEVPEAGNYYTFVHDHSNYIEASKDYNQTKRWFYTNSCQVMRFDMVNGQPKPNNAAEALYLCYLYLGQQEQDKAWRMLEDISRYYPLTGSVEEQIYLSWIIYALPAPTYNGFKSDAVLNSPRDVACQLKALSLYSSFLTDGHLPQRIYENHSEFSLVEKLNINLPLTIQTKYNKWLNVKDHLSATFILNPEEQKNLLKTTFLPPTSIDYSLKTLELKNLLTLKNRLQALIESSSNIPLFYKIRLSQLEEQINALSSLSHETTVLIKEHIPETALNITAESILKIPLEDLNQRISLDNEENLPKITSATEFYDFKQNFNILLRIAGEGRYIAEHPYLSKLKQWCEGYLRTKAYRNLNSPNKETTFDLMVNLFYLVLLNPQCLNQLKDLDVTVDDLVKTIQNDKIPGFELTIEKNIKTEIITSTQEIIKELETLTFSYHHILLQPTHNLPLYEQIARYIPEEKFRVFLEKGYIEMLHATKKYEDNVRLLNPQMDKAELEAGSLQFELAQFQRDIAQQTLASQEIRESILNATILYQQKMQSMLNDEWAVIQETANSALQEIQLASGERQLLTREEILQCYLHEDYVYTMERTNLSQKACKSLHDLIHQAISKEILNQQALRLALELKQVGETPDAIQLVKVAQVLLSEIDVTIENDPALMLFQYLNKDNEGKAGMMLRKRQVEALENLLKTPNVKDVTQFNESIEKVVMGGGKSKVLLPLLAQKKATGINLVVIEVPRALLETNFHDLKQTSQTLFNQKAYIFDFNRESDCSPKKLESIFDKLNDIIIQRGYLVTTGEAIQSLELKYLEMLLSPPIKPSEKNEWEQQVKGMRNILTLFKQSGDVIIDEVHQALMLKKKLNYTIGKLQPIPELWIQLSVQFYRFLQVSSSGDLIHEFINHSQSPLNPYLENLYQQEDPLKIRTAIYAYLNNEQEPDFFNKIDPEVINIFAFYKEQLRLYPQTLENQYKVHYGPSKLPNKTVFERALAIPYAANEKPNEQSRFGNTFETIHYTIQSLLQEGLNQELMVYLLHDWIEKANLEFKMHPSHYSTLDETPTAKKIIEQYLKLIHISSLREIDLQDTNQIQTLLTQLSFNSDLILEILEKNILKQISIEPAILHSDAYNHVDMYHSVQGISGTPYNLKTYHQRFSYNYQTSLGTDGYIEKVIKEKNTPVQVATLKDVDGFLKEILDKKTKPRAIIDISATFAGITNLEIAKALGKYYQDTSQVRYILYFNEQEILCAWDITKQSIKVLGTSDAQEINRLLNCKPEERFTYYDQSHTVGADIKQGNDTCGICLINKKTKKSQMLQGAKRMRGLEEEQQIEIVVPESLKGVSLDVLFEQMQENEDKEVREENFYSAIAKLDNWFRNQSLELVQSLSGQDIEQKILYAKAFQSFWVEKKSTDLAQYRAIYQEEETKTLLDTYKEKLLKQWWECLKQVNLPFSSNSEIELALDSIINDALPYCMPKYLNSQFSHSTEVQIQKEQLIKKEVEQLVQQEVQISQAKPLAYFAWEKDTLAYFHQTGKIKHTQYAPHKNHIEIQPSLDISETLNQYCQTSIFSPALQVSTNYAYIHEGQIEMEGSCLEPIHAILFRLDNDQLSAVIIDTQEVNEISKILDEEPSFHGKIWLSSTKPVCLSGKAPKEINLREDYHQILQQIYFFNGECKTLLQQTHPSEWLSEETEKKLNFFESALLPYRLTDIHDLSRLRDIYTHSSPGLNYLKNHAFDDLSHIEWKKIYPLAFPLELAEIRKLTDAYLKANQMFQNSVVLNPEDFALEGCSARAIEQFKQHLMDLKNIKIILQKILTHQTLDTLTTQERALLKTFLSLTISEDLPPFIDVVMRLIQSSCVIHKEPFEQIIHQNLSAPINRQSLFLNASEHVRLALALYIYPNDLSLVKRVSETLNHSYSLVYLLQHTKIQPKSELINFILSNNTDLSVPVLKEIAAQRLSLDNIQKLLTFKNLNHDILNRWFEHCEPSDETDLIFTELMSHSLTNLNSHLIMAEKATHPQTLELMTQFVKEPLEEKFAAALMGNTIFSVENLLHWIKLPNATVPFIIKILTSHLLLNLDLETDIYSMIHVFSKKDQLIILATLFIQTGKLQSWISSSEFRLFIQYAETDLLAREKLEQIFRMAFLNPKIRIENVLANMGTLVFQRFIPYTETFSILQWKVLLKERGKDDLYLLLQQAPHVPLEILNECIHLAQNTQEMLCILQRKEIDLAWLQQHYILFLNAQSSVLSVLTARILAVSDLKFKEIFITHLLQSSHLNEQILISLLRQPSLSSSSFALILPKIRSEFSLLIFLQRDDLMTLLQQNEEIGINLIKHPLWSYELLQKLFKNSAIPISFYETLFRYISVEQLESYITKDTPMNLSLVIAQLPQTNLNILHVLLQNSHLHSEELYRMILKHPDADQSVFKYLNPELLSTQIPELVHLWHDDRSKNQDGLEFIFKQNLISSELFIELLNHASSESSFNRIFNEIEKRHLMNEPMVLNTLIQHRLLSNLQMIKILQLSQPPISLIHEFVRNAAEINRELFSLILTHPHIGEEIYIDLLKHLSKRTFDEFTQHPLFKNIKKQILHNPQWIQPSWKTNFVTSLNQEDFLEYLKLNPKEYLIIFDRNDLSINTLIQLINYDADKVFEYINQYKIVDERLESLLLDKLSHEVVHLYLISNNPIPYSRLMVFLQLPSSFLYSFEMDKFVEKILFESGYAEDEKKIVLSHLIEKYKKNVVVPENYIRQMIMEDETQPLLVQLFSNLNIKEKLSYLPDLKSPLPPEIYKAILSEAHYYVEKNYELLKLILTEEIRFINIQGTEYSPENIKNILQSANTDASSIQLIVNYLNHLPSAKIFIEVISILKGQGTFSDSVNELLENENLKPMDSVLLLKELLENSASINYSARTVSFKYIIHRSKIENFSILDILFSDSCKKITEEDFEDFILERLPLKMILEHPKLPINLYMVIKKVRTKNLSEEVQQLMKNFETKSQIFVEKTIAIKDELQSVKKSLDSEESVKLPMDKLK